MKNNMAARQDTTALAEIKRAFRRQKIKGVLLHHNMAEFVNARSVLITRKYSRLPNGMIVRTAYNK